VTTEKVCPDTGLIVMVVLEKRTVESL